MISVEVFFQYTYNCFHEDILILMSKCIKDICSKRCLSIYFNRLTHWMMDLVVCDDIMINYLSFSLKRLQINMNQLNILKKRQSTMIEVR